MFSHSFLIIIGNYNVFHNIFVNIHIHKNKSFISILFFSRFSEIVKTQKYLKVTATYKISTN